MLYLVRHGESEWNLLRRTQGALAHPALTSKGREQSRAAAVSIAADCDGNDETSILSSDLVRAVETAHTIKEIAGGRLTLDARLREQGYGELEGRSYSETETALAKVDRVTSALPGGESVRVVRDRMRGVIDELDPDQVTVIVGHGDALRILLDDLIGSRSRIVAPAWPNGSVVRVGGSGDVHWLVGVEVANNI